MPAREIMANTIVGTLVTGACAVGGSILGVVFQSGFNNTVESTPDPLDLRDPTSGATVGFIVGGMVGVAISYFVLRHQWVRPQEDVAVRREPAAVESGQQALDDPQPSREQTTLQASMISDGTKDPQSPGVTPPPQVVGAAAIHAAALPAQARSV